LIVETGAKLNGKCSMDTLNYACSEKMNDNNGEEDLSSTAVTNHDGQQQDEIDWLREKIY
jgi:hypothetical protein